MILENMSLTDSLLVEHLLRGRQGTTQLAFGTDGGAIAFPDVFVHYEGWVIPRSRLESLRHHDFLHLLRDNGTAWFRFAPYSRNAIYRSGSPISRFASSRPPSTS